MRYLIVSDIHGNLPALEAILASPQAQTCERMISLGDQINCCPQSREVLLRLRALGATMLMGNHEERLRHLGEAAMSGYTWALSHWTAKRIADLPLELPIDLRLGSVLCTHGAPGDPYRLLDPDSVAQVLGTLPPEITHMLSGHRHVSWLVKAHGRIALNAGAAGSAHTCGSGLAPFAILDMDEEHIALEQHRARYDVMDVACAFIDTGCAAEAPEACRHVMQNLLTGEDTNLGHLVRHVHAVAKAHALDPDDAGTWALADRSFPWVEAGVDSVRYWWEMEKRLM